MAHIKMLVVVPCLLAPLHLAVAKESKDAKPAKTADPSLAQVDNGGGPLRFSAPPDWEIHTHAPQKKALATVATLSQACASGEVHTLFIQLDEQFNTPEAILSDQFPNATPRKTGAWSCVQGSDHEALCAGRVKGLKSLAAVYLGSVSASAFEGAGGVRLASKIASSISWKGGAPDKIPEWSRNGAPAIDVKCPD